MRLNRPFLAFAAASLAVATQAQAADPFITVAPPRADGPRLAWWLLDMASAPTGQRIAGLTLDRIDEALDETESRWCAADALTPDSFASSDPALPAQIRDDLAEAGMTFRATTRMTGLPIEAVVGNFLSCADETAPFVLLVDQRSHVPRVVFVRIFTGAAPFVAMRRDGEDLVFSSCLECDHAETLTYDRRARRFAWRSDGM